MLSVSRLRAFTGHQDPTAFQFAAYAIFALSGVADVLLFFYTRTGLFRLPGRESRNGGDVAENGCENNSVSLGV